MSKIQEKKEEVKEEVKPHENCIIGAPWSQSKPSQNCTNKANGEEICTSKKQKIDRN